MPDDQWPPPAPHVNKAFKKAHTATNKNTPPPPALPVFTKKEMQELENQRKKPAPQLNMTPSGAKVNTAADQKREKDIASMKERLQRIKGKARDDFERSR
jgi:hypothetical protein